MENFSKKGRPRKFADIYEQYATRELLMNHGPRTLNNKLHMARALAALVSDMDATGYDYSYLFHGHRQRSVLLYELGRWPNAASIVAAARYICELRPGAVAGVAILRQLRSGVSP